MKLLPPGLKLGHVLSIGPRRPLQGYLSVCLCFSCPSLFQIRQPCNGCLILNVDSVLAAPHKQALMPRAACGLGSIPSTCRLWAELLFRLSGVGVKASVAAPETWVSFHRQAQMVNNFAACRPPLRFSTGKHFPKGMLGASTGQAVCKCTSRPSATPPVCADHHIPPFMVQDLCMNYEVHSTPLPAQVQICSTLHARTLNGSTSSTRNSALFTARTPTDFCDCFTLQGRNC